MYTIYKEVVLDRILKRYNTVLIVSEAPPNLNHITRNIRLEKVSLHRPYINCGVAFKSMYDPNKYMTIEELPQLISFLYRNNYIIDYEANKILASHMNSNFLLSFYEKN